MKNIINVITSTLATMLVYFLGGFDIALQLLLTVIVIDYLSGICRAIYTRKVNSKVGVKGIIKKVGYLLIVALSVILDRITSNTGAIRTLVIYFFVANEGISVIENASILGLPVPQKVKEVLEQLKSESNKEKSGR